MLRLGVAGKVVSGSLNAGVLIVVLNAVPAPEFPEMVMVSPGAAGVV